MLTIGEEKMSKSLKNFFLIEEILKKFTPEVVRFYLLNASYRQPLDYNEKSLEESAKALERLQNTYNMIRTATPTPTGSDDSEGLCAKAWRSFEAHMDDDFNTREAIADIYDLAREANRLNTEGRLSKEGAQKILGVFERFNTIFDVLSSRKEMTTIEDSKISDLIKKRDDARRRKDYAEADRIRKDLEEKGIVLQDTKDGVVWKRK
jgi:cysteinyl-tRNA synthetase